MRPLQGIFPPTAYPNLLIGLDAPDDAAVYRVSDERAIISTMDFFPPVVDDPYAFGVIAAANALSDIYAMGGTPLMAINLVAYPDGLELAILSEILRGGAETAREAGIAIAGGHTITDKEPKYGLSVTGEIHPDKIIRKSGAILGDVLILTKPLGTGVITTAIKNNTAKPEHIKEVIAGMSRLNQSAAKIATQYNEEATDIHAMTDITGYSLIGHGHEMAHLSNVDFQIEYSALQWYSGAIEYAKADIFPGGMHRNREYFQQFVTISASLQQWQEYLLYDPQTSGGLLMAVAPHTAPQVLDTLIQHGNNATIIGRVTNGSGNLHILL